MKPFRHAIASLAAGITPVAAFHNPTAGAVCVLAGVLPDIDHILEFIVHHGRQKFSWPALFEACEQTNQLAGPLCFPRLILVLHSSELAIILWLITAASGSVYAMAAACGYSLHMIMDMCGNPLRPRAYFLLWRLGRGFKTCELHLLSKEEP